MKFFKLSSLCLMAAVIAAPIITAAPAAAWKKKCYHCYSVGYGKKVCHNDCRCYRKHW